MEAMCVSITKLEATEARQLTQLKLEKQGVRSQHRAPSPRGSRPYLREKAARHEVLKLHVRPPSTQAELLEAAAVKGALKKSRAGHMLTKDELQLLERVEARRANAKKLDIMSPSTKAELETAAVKGVLSKSRAGHMLTRDELQLLERAEARQSEASNFADEMPDSGRSATPMSARPGSRSATPRSARGGSRSGTPMSARANVRGKDVEAGAAAIAAKLRQATQRKDGAVAVIRREWRRSRERLDRQSRENMEAKQREEAERAAREEEAAREEAERDEAARLAAEEEERRRIVDMSDPNSSRGRWARGDQTIMKSLLHSPAVAHAGGSWLVAQSLMRVSKVWRSMCLRWCASFDAVLLSASGGPMRGWGSGVVPAILKTTPSAFKLHFEGFIDSTVSELALMAGTLVELTLSSCTGVGSLLEVTSFHALRLLTLTHCDVSVDGLKHLAKGSPGLRSLRLVGCPAATGILAFARNLPNVLNGAEPAALRSFIYLDRLSDEVVRSVARTCPRMEVVELRGVGSSAALKVAALNWTHLRELRLQGLEGSAKWVDADLSLLAQGCRHLRLLHLENGDVSRLTGEALSSFTELVDLSLARLGTAAILSTDAMLALAKATATTLRRLDLSACTFEDGTAAVEALLSRCTALEHLELAGVSVQSHAFAHVTCSKLQYAGLNGTAIDSTAVIALVRASDKLTALDLRNTAIDDDALVAIHDHVATRLERLDLTRSGCTHQGFRSTWKACKKLPRKEPVDRLASSVCADVQPIPDGSAAPTRPVYTFLHVDTEGEVSCVRLRMVMSERVQILRGALTPLTAEIKHE